MSDTTTTPAAASAATTWPVLVEIPDFVGPTPATTDGRLWNGWQTPRFDFDAACSVALALVGRGVPAAYDPDRDLFVTLEQTDLSFDDLADNGDDDDILWAEWSRGPDGRYAIGAFGWTWEPAIVDPADVQPETLARVFVAVLREWLSPSELAAVRAANAAETTPGVCHSHDVCDANMAMDAALRRLGVDVDNVAPDDLTPLWNAAWDIARAGDLTDAAPAT